jgi:hypothetical protein
MSVKIWSGTPCRRGAASNASHAGCAVARGTSIAEVTHRELASIVRPPSARRHRPVGSRRPHPPAAAPSAKPLPTADRPPADSADAPSSVRSRHHAGWAYRTCTIQASSGHRSLGPNDLVRSSHPTRVSLLRQLNPVLRGWCTYFRHGVSNTTFGHRDQYTWHRVVRWIRKRLSRTKWDVVYRRYLPSW